MTAIHCFKWHRGLENSDNVDMKLVNVTAEMNVSAALFNGIERDESAANVENNIIGPAISNVAKIVIH